MDIIVQPSSIGGSLRAPGSKSVFQRAIAASLLARGISTLHECQWCSDSIAAIGVAQALGASVHSGSGSALLHSDWRRPATMPPGTIAISGGLDSRSGTLDCGESGLCIRLFSPIASMTGKPQYLAGHGSLMKRPLHLIESPLRQLGAEVSTSNGYAPVSVKGPLLGGECSIDGSQGSQVLTGLLFALPLAERETVIHVDGLTSRPYIDLTIQVLDRFGVRVEHDSYKDFFIQGTQRYSPSSLEIEGDWSGAAFLIVAAAVAGKPEGLIIPGLDTQSAQADRSIMDAMHAAGAMIEQRVGGLWIGKSELKGFDFNANDCPDLFPPLAALAAYCNGESRISGVGRLVHKESDRACAIVSEFSALGVSVTIDEDTMVIQGGRVEGGDADSHRDHRMAMAEAVLALGAKKPVKIHGADSINKSYPEFFAALGSAGMHYFQ